MDRKSLLLSMILCIPQIILGQCVTLKGTILDALTKKPLSARLSVKLEGNRKNIGNSNQEGFFSVQLPCAATSLSVEKEGFRTVTMPLSGNTETQTYFLNLDLYAVDKQTNDRPYFQSEQTQLVLNNAESQSTGIATRYFKLVDVQTKNPVKGEICLIYTKSDKKKCLTLTQTSKGEKVVFDQEDIIAVIVNANGYQTYNGNLIIDQLDNKSSVYEISLSKMLTFVAFSADSPDPMGSLKVEIFTKTGAKLLPSVINNRYAVVALSPNEIYNLKGTLNSQSFEQKIKPSDGLNFIGLQISQAIVSPPTIPHPIQKPTAIQPPSVPPFQIIYFEQSHYELLPKAKVSLDSIANFLVSYPTVTAQITGFTDNVGDSFLNKTLSEFRAKVTVHYLVSRGVAEAQLKWYAMGENAPAAANDKENTKALNRRVEIKFLVDTVSLSK